MKKPTRGSAGRKQPKIKDLATRKAQAVKGGDSTTDRSGVVILRFPTGKGN